MRTIYCLIFPTLTPSRQLATWPLSFHREGKSDPDVIGRVRGESKIEWLEIRHFFIPMTYQKKNNKLKTLKYDLID
jgi:hypothetical protein